MISSVQSGGGSSPVQPTSALSSLFSSNTTAGTSAGSGSSDAISSQGGTGSASSQMEADIVSVLASVLNVIAQQLQQSSGSGQQSQTGDSVSSPQGDTSQGGSAQPTTSQAQGSGQSQGSGTSSTDDDDDDGISELLQMIMQEVQTLESELADNSGSSSGASSGAQDGDSAGGSGDATSGDGNATSGGDNSVAGNGNSVSGGNNNVSGNGNDVSGNGNTVSGGASAGGSSTAPAAGTSSWQVGSSLAQNQKTVVNALQNAGATKSETATILAMGEQETTNLDVSGRDSSKDGTSAQNYSAFNLNPSVLQLAGVDPSQYSSLNNQSNLGTAAVDVLHAFRNGGEQKTLDAQRGGSTAEADGTSYGAQQYVSDIQSSAQQIENTNSWTNGERIAANLYHV